MKIWLLLGTFALSSCALVNHQSSELLYNEYQEYKSLVALSNYEYIANKFSKKYLKNMIKSENNVPPELGLTTPFWKYLAGEIRTEYSHYEKIESEIGCMTINGLDKFDKPSSLSLYYIKEDGEWVINGVMVGGHSSIKDFYREPTCPSPEILKGG